MESISHAGRDLLTVLQRSCFWLAMRRLTMTTWTSLLSLQLFPMRSSTTLLLTQFSADQRRIRREYGETERRTGVVSILLSRKTAGSSRFRLLTTTDWPS